MRAPLAPERFARTGAIGSYRPLPPGSSAMSGRIRRAPWRNRFSMSQRRPTLLALLLALAVAVGGCSNGGGDRVQATKKKAVEEVAVGAGETTTTVAAPAPASVDLQ